MTQYFEITIPQFFLELETDIDALIDYDGEDDDTFTETQEVVTIESVERHGNILRVYPMLDVLDLAEFGIQKKLQKAFDFWVASFE